MKTDYQQQVINRIKLIRESKGFSQLTFSKLLDISPGQMGNIDSCKQPHKYTLKQILRICDFLEITVEEVFFANDDRSRMFSTRDVINAIIKYQDKSL
ncbi:helix-turn-helix transcriptional regulator [uncultured Parabacteroides sp.]|uniref:helix-turn-helix transcriptional regulator n=1 Tax=uncultured Parabacteroides sp. TaxID=512312 RepID=UPI00260B5484|nr:helix-turn-helix transcriptional regulator [uncultured Parabacteroides sp.]